MFDRLQGASRGTVYNDAPIQHVSCTPKDNHHANHPSHHRQPTHRLYTQRSVTPEAMTYENDFDPIVE
jgi:hypothetical protein